MLEKMGWSKGKGLGAQEQGATEHIKVQVKNNHLGLGATINNEDNWIAHQDDFNQLLAELNTCHGQEATDSPDNKEKKSFNLEEKSKVSKNRVHYMKFTKGKDLSSRSKMDLDCIFGKRQSKKTSEAEGSPATEDKSEASTTTTSTITIQEYFAQRMAQLRTKSQQPTPEPGLSETPMGWKRGKKKNREVAADQDVENFPQTTAWRPKKKKREEEESQGYTATKEDQAKQQDPFGDEAAEDRVQAPGGQECTPKPRKSRAKTKRQQLVEAAVDPAPDEAPVKRKKKKKKKKASG